MRDKDFFIKKYNPVTRAMCFLEVDFEQLAEYMHKRYIYLNKDGEYNWTVGKVKLSGNLEEKLQHMLPLVNYGLDKRMISQTKSRWIMYTSNGRFGANSSNEGSYLAEKLGGRVIRLVMTEDVRGGARLCTIHVKRLL